MLEGLKVGMFGKDGRVTRVQQLKVEKLKEGGPCSPRTRDWGPEGYRGDGVESSRPMINTKWSTCQPK